MTQKGRGRERGEIGEEGGRGGQQGAKITQVWVLVLHRREKTHRESSRQKKKKEKGKVRPVKKKERVPAPRVFPAAARMREGERKKVRRQSTPKRPRRQSIPNATPAPDAGL